MFPVRQYVYLAAGFAALAAIGFAGRQVYNAGYQAATLEHESRARIIAEAADAFDRQLAKRIGAIKIENVTIRQELQKEIRENVIYRNCVASDRVLGLTNAAITGTPVPASSLVLLPVGAND